MNWTQDENFWLHRFDKPVMTDKLRIKVLKTPAAANNGIHVHVHHAKCCSGSALDMGPHITEGDEIMLLLADGVIKA